VAGWTVAAVLQVAGLSLFLYGFFPVKPTLRGPHCLSDFFNSI
jgi:ethanolamine phosphate transferase 2 subunit G